jgi:hypothetical protein
VNDNEDLELAALERKLEDAFQTTRPRVDFEDELWLRMQSKRPVWSRLQDLVTGFFDSVREAPAIPATAVAAILIVVIGIGIISTSNLHLGGGGTASLATRNSEDGAGQYAAAPFGRVPAPGMQPPTAPALSGGPKVSGPEDLSGATVYYGPANLTWSGKLDSSLASAPVFRYTEPQASDAAVFAQKVGATSQSSPPPSPYLGAYRSRDFTVVIRGTIRTPSSEPAYLLTMSAPAASSSNDPVQVAKAFLQAHNLTPDWPYTVVTEQSGPVTHVLFLRQFAIPGQGNVDAVDGSGSQYGLQVEVQNSRVLSVSGPLPLELDSALYPLISTEQAVRSALSSIPAAPGTGNVPAVSLTSARLVYALAVDGDHSYYEPAFLFSGTFTMNGVTYVKRVLVPAVTQSQLSS